MIVDKVIRSIAERILASKAKDAEAGKLGPLAHRLFTIAKGHLTEISFALGCILVPALLATGNDGPAEWVGVLAAAGVSAGIVRNNWAQEVPPEVLSSGWYNFLRNHAGDAATIFGVAAATVQTCDPATAEFLARLHLSCNSASVLLVIIAAVWAHLGLSAVARLAPPPRPRT
jgi:hypothetical protein